MELHERFEGFVKNHQQPEMLELLKAASISERKALAPHIKKLSRHYEAYKQDDRGSFRQVGTAHQTDMLLLASFVCFNKTDFEKKYYSSWIFQPKYFDKVSDWYVPEWLGDFMNGLAKTEHIHYSINYELVISITKNHGIRPAKSLIAMLLPNYLHDREKINDRKVTVCKPEKLFIHPVTLQEHIWYLFEEESKLYFTDGFIRFEGQAVDDSKGWTSTFIELSKTKKLDRMRLLKESLLAGNRGFNKLLSGWFAELFQKLEPEPDELILLQKELFTVLNAEHSKPVSVVLQHLKKIADRKELDAQSLLDTAPVILSSTTKGNVTSVLSLLEMIAKKRKDLQPSIARLSSQAMIHQDDTLQKKAAKIIDKYADDSIKEDLAAYKDSMMIGSVSMLSRFLEQEENREEDNATIAEEFDIALPGSEAISAVSSVEDLTYLAAQAFDNNEWFHIDLLPAALINLQDDIKGAVIGKLQPALQRALQTIRNSSRATMGYFDHMLAVFFVDVCIHLIRKHPDDAKPLTDLFAQFDKKLGDPNIKFTAISPADSYISSWKTHYNDPFYEPYKELLTEALSKFRAGDKLPLLSTPTHRSGKIAAKILVERIMQYSKKGALAEKIDGLIAIARIDTNNTTEALDLVKKNLKGEWLALLTFLLTPGAKPIGDLSPPEAWMMAALSKKSKTWYPEFEKIGYDENKFNQHLGRYAWEVKTIEYTVSRYDYKKMANFDEKETRNELVVDLYKTPADSQQKDSSIGGLVSKIKKKLTSKTAPKILYDFQVIKSTYFSQEVNDIRRALMLTPNNLDAFLPQITFRTMRYSNFFDETSKKFAIEVLQVLYENWDDQEEIAHLFLAASLLSSDKTAASIAAEIWVKYSPMNKIDNEMLGTIIGKYERIEFAPLKRLSDVMTQSMYKVSTQHNKMLRIVIENCLKQLPEKPIKNLKKLTELYGELIR